MFPHSVAHKIHPTQRRHQVKMARTDKSRNYSSLSLERKSCEKILWTDDSAREPSSLTPCSVQRRSNKDRSQGVNYLFLILFSLSSTATSGNVNHPETSIERFLHIPSCPWSKVRNISSTLTRKVCNMVQDKNKAVNLSCWVNPETQDQTGNQLWLTWLKQNRKSVLCLQLATAWLHLWRAHKKFCTKGWKSVRRKL